MNDNFEFELSRTFNAPREKLWQAWTNEEQLKKWFGPKNWPVSKSKLELKIGGSYHYAISMPDGSELWGKWVFTEITRPKRLVYIASFSDKDGNITRNPWSETWPLEAYSVVEFVEKDGKTTLNMKARAHNTGDVEHKTFEDGATSMKGGWTGTFDQLEEFLKI